MPDKWIGQDEFDGTETPAQDLMGYTVKADILKSTVSSDVRLSVSEMTEEGTGAVCSTKNSATKSTKRSTSLRVLMAPRRICNTSGIAETSVANVDVANAGELLDFIGAHVLAVAVAKVEG